MSAKRHKSGDRGKGRPTQRSGQTLWVAAALEGCEDIARGEIVRRLRGACTLLDHRRRDEIHFRCEGDVALLLSLRTVQSLFVRRDFAVQRPRTLLSPEHLAALVALVRQAQSVRGAEGAVSLRFDAAGADSPTMRRIARALEDALHMPFDREGGDGVLVFRPGATGWEVLCRVGNRPLATRPWRQVDYRGSLNAALAASMVELSEPRRTDRFINLMCGGGTLLIERLLRQRARCAVGVDISPQAIRASRVNALAAGVGARLQLVLGDARTCPLPDGGFDAVTADLPYGRAHGMRAENALLYERVFAEAARLCRAGGRAVFISEDIAAFHRALQGVNAQWKLLDERRMVQRTYRPRCVTLERRR